MYRKKFYLCTCIIYTESFLIANYSPVYQMSVAFARLLLFMTRSNDFPSVDRVKMSHK